MAILSGEVVAGIRAIASPGHTPGHRCVVVEDDDDPVLLTGDLVHQPIQIAHPEWASWHDEDEMLGIASRRILLFRARQRGWRLAVSHFAEPFGRCADDGWTSTRR